MVADILKERGSNYGNFHTQANLSQTLNSIVQQHYYSTHANPDGTVEPLPQFMLEAIHMICHKLARIANGDPSYVDSWQDIAGYSQLVVDILQTPPPQPIQEPQNEVSFQDNITPIDQ